MLLQRFVKLTGYLPVKLFCRVRVTGRQNLPKGPCIMVANHGSMLDSVILQVLFPSRNASYLCAKRLFQCPRICQAFLRKMGAVPVTDGVGELSILKQRADENRPNSMFVFFSQGSISQTRSSFMPGAAMLALQTGLPLVPVFLRCAPFYKGGSCVRIGQPVPVGPAATLNKESAEAITQDIRTKVYELSIHNK